MEKLGGATKKSFKKKTEKKEKKITEKKTPRFSGLVCNSSKPCL
jgi:hypothetical protein